MSLVLIDEGALSACPTAHRPADDAAANDEWFTEVYERLKRIASRQLARDRAMTLGTTELVHELYERMSRQDLARLGGPNNFFAYAANAMRNLLIDRARHRLSLKAGGDWLRVTLSRFDEPAAAGLAVDVIALDTALDALRREDARAARVVELRYFAGLSAEQVAQLLDVDRRTVTRDWTFARAFLQERISGEPAAAAC